MKRLIHSTGLLLLSLALASCGSVSNNSPAPGAGTAGVISKTYSKVLIQDFTAGPDSGADAAVGSKFAGVIASAITSAKPGTQIVRQGKADASTLVIGGEVTRFVEGNAALRLLVGMGAGSSYFDATIRISDGGNGSALNTLKADKNSWGLGGGLAASQTVDTFMSEAAKKTAATVVPYVK
ncbi:MAG: DUF4410 domain-containing protein [Prosthecobacter sp.]